MSENNQNQKPKYGVLPPIRDSSDGMGHYVLPGHFLDDWRANLPKALEEMIANFTPEEKARYEQIKEANRVKRDQEKRDRKKKRR